MTIIEKLQISNYRNLRNVNLDDLKDLNIFIGPSNCGKSNILNAINLLSKLKVDPRNNFSCGECTKIQGIYNTQGYSKEERKFQISRSCYEAPEDESYKRNERFEIAYAFSRGYLHKKLDTTYHISSNNVIELINSAIEKSNVDDEIKKNLILHIKKLGLTDDHNFVGLSDEPSFREVREKPYTLVIGQSEGTGKDAMSKDISLLSIGDITNKIKEEIVFCPDARLERYKGETTFDYILKSTPRGDDKTRLVGLIKNIVDPKIKTESTNMNKKEMGLIDNGNFESYISEQGSGIRSLICLGWDIIRAKDESIVLVDEPEVGLNPMAKQELLKFLLKESETKQIFITTHDPTFMNPILWNNKNLKVFLYSWVNDSFIKIDLDKNKEDSETFAGYLPHTVSFKDTHIYVEGTSDVYILQIFLQRYLRKNKFENFSEIFNKVGIYHLGGDFWKHLLYTIPKPPYKCIVILDGDKKVDAKKVCDHYNKANSIKGIWFEFFDVMEPIKYIEHSSERILVIDETNPEKDTKYRLRGYIHPVYCLKEDCIEEYLIPKPNYKDSKYNKKIDGPKIALEMEEIPKEIEEMFDVFLKFSGISTKNKQIG